MKLWKPELTGRYSSVSPQSRWWAPSKLWSFCAALILPVSLAAEVVAVEGSELIGEPVHRILQERAEQQGDTLRLNFSGSYAARQRLEAGVVNMAVLVDDPSADPLGDEWVSVPLGYAAAYVVAPADVPVNQVTYAQLQQIFGEGSSVATTRWGDLGEAGIHGIQPVVPYVTSAGTGFSSILFAQFALGERQIRSDVPQPEDVAATVQAMSRDEGPMAIMPRLPGAGGESTSRWKALLVASAPGTVAFSPTPENLHAGDYPLCIRLNLVLARSEARSLLDWLRLWYSTEMAEALEDSLIVPLPISTRNQQVFDLEVLD